MYGGVSLAIYMYGVAQELLSLVKATAPERPANTEPGDLAFEDDGTTMDVYRKLARVLGDSKQPASGPTRVRFVVDLITGSSAGGLNGVCLATVLANDTPQATPDLGELERLWVRNGGLETMLAGRESTYDDDTGEFDERLELGDAPPSLLNGLRFYKLLARVLHDKLATQSGVGNSRLVDQLDLWVTATDLDGRVVTVPIANADVSERHHAHRFHFAYDPAAERNDFEQEIAPFVAFAGRSTSSFPVAFEPIRLEKTVPFHEIDPAWRDELFPDIAAEVFSSIPLSDGGILDNKPFSYATQGLSRRPATLPVDRYLVYVEPDPKPAREEPGRHWTAMDTAIAALTGIPRSETIRDDLELVHARNRAIRRARKLLFETALTPQEQRAHGNIVARLPRDEWRNMGFAEMVAAQAEFGPTYPVYHRLKVNAVCEYLARLLGSALRLEADEDLPKLRAVVDLWKRDRYQEEPGRVGADGFPRTEADFLFRFDMPFRMRRLANVRARLRDLEPGDKESERRFFKAAGCTPTQVDPDELRAVRRSLGIALERLVQVELRVPSAPRLQDALEASEVNRATVSAMGAHRDELLETQAPAGIAADGAPFDVVVETAIRDATDLARAFVEDAIGTKLTADDVRELRAAATPEFRRVVRYYYDAFEAYDLVYLPLSYETAVADTNPVDVFRISPLDAQRPLDVSRGLKGVGLGHFAAFVDASWRQHDIAWGRMNAAEILIRNLLPDDEDGARALVDEAHAIITTQYKTNMEPVAGLETTEVGDDGQPLLGDVPVTAVPPTKTLLRRAARIGSATMQAQLRAKGSTVPADAVQLGADAAFGKSFLVLLRDLYGLLPTTARVALWGIVALLTAVGAIAAAAGAWSLAMLAVGLLVGPLLLVVIGVWFAGRQVKGAFERALDRF